MPRNLTQQLRCHNDLQSYDHRDHNSINYLYKFLFGSEVSINSYKNRYKKREKKITKKTLKKRPKITNVQTLENLDNLGAGKNDQQKFSPISEFKLKNFQHIIDICHLEYTKVVEKEIQNEELYRWCVTNTFL